RLAIVLGVLSVGVLLLTALSLVANHIEISMSLPGDPPGAGEGSVQSTDFQLGFRDARLYASRAQWLRRSAYSISLWHGPQAIPLDWLSQFENDGSWECPRKQVQLNGWVLSGALGIYPLIVLLRRVVFRRARNDLVCRGCGYNLIGKVSGVCPECGSST